MSIDRLRHFAASPTDPDAAQWVAARVREYIAAAGTVTLDEALGVRPRRGEWPWWRRERRQREREAARNLLVAFGGDAATAHRALTQYANGRGRTAADAAGGVYRDPRTRALHDFLRLSKRIPMDPRTLKSAAAETASRSPISLHADCGPIEA